MPPRSSRSSSVGTPEPRIGWWETPFVPTRTLFSRLSTYRYGTLRVAAAPLTRPCRGHYHQQTTSNDQGHHRDFLNHHDDRPEDKEAENGISLRQSKG